MQPLPGRLRLFITPSSLFTPALLSPHFTSPPFPISFFVFCSLRPDCSRGPAERCLGREWGRGWLLGKCLPLTAPSIEARPPFLTLASAATAGGYTTAGYTTSQPTPGCVSKRCLKRLLLKAPAGPNRRRNRNWDILLQGRGQNNFNPCTLDCWVLSCIAYPVWPILHDLSCIAYPL